MKETCVQENSTKWTVDLAISMWAKNRSTSKLYIANHVSSYWEMLLHLETKYYNPIGFTTFWKRLNLENKYYFDRYRNQLHL